jgi:hypothetical protein
MRIRISWILLAIIIPVIAFVGYKVTTVDEVNARVAEEIRTNPNGERAAKTMLLTLNDGSEYPVNYLWEDNLVFMGIDGRWWRRFVGEGESVSMEIQGQTLKGHAVTLLDDPAYQADVFARLRPTVPKWLPDWLNGKLVVITLTTGSNPKDSENADD